MTLYRIQQLPPTTTPDNNTVFAVEQDGDLTKTTKKVTIATLKTVFEPKGNYALVSSGISAPTTTPSKVGDIFVDINAKKLYFATGINSSADWIIAN